jgi:hypothetical protein
MTIASPLGTSTVDPISVERFNDDAYCQEFYRTKENLWKSTEKLSSFISRAKEFDAIFVVGGFGRRSSLLLQSSHFIFLARTEYLTE